MSPDRKVTAIIKAIDFLTDEVRLKCQYSYELFYAI